MDSDGFWGLFMVKRVIGGQIVDDQQLVADVGSDVFDCEPGVGVIRLHDEVIGGGVLGREGGIKAKVCFSM